MLSISFFGSSEKSRTEKRAHERYDLRLPVRIRWKDASGKEKEEKTTIEDISFSGIFIVCRNPIKKGCKVNVEIDLPIDEAGEIKRRVSALGRVVRNVTLSNPDKGSFGCGVRLDKFHFLRPWYMTLTAQTPSDSKDR